jgi:putative PIN family toxin of toxin-antitoxin system
VIRAVFDTNVVVAAGSAKTGSLANLVNRLIDEDYALVLSEYILDEARVALSAPYWRLRLLPLESDQILRFFREWAEIVPLLHIVEGIASHRHDDPILATAVSGEAAYIVSGDKALLRLRVFQGVEIVTPREFLTRLDEGSAS